MDGMEVGRTAETVIILWNTIITSVPTARWGFAIFADIIDKEFIEYFL